MQVLATCHEILLMQPSLIYSQGKQCNTSGHVSNIILCNLSSLFQEYDAHLLLSAWSISLDNK